MRIRFLSDQIYHQGGPKSGPQFPAGTVIDADDVQSALKLADAPSPEWVEAWLNRWVQRGVAEVVDGRTPATTHDDAGGRADGEAVDLASMTRVQLDALAVERGVDISDCRNKGDVIAALELAAEAGE